MKNKRRGHLNPEKRQRSPLKSDSFYRKKTTIIRIRIQQRLEDQMAPQRAFSSDFQKHGGNPMKHKLRGHLNLEKRQRLEDQMVPQ